MAIKKVLIANRGEIAVRIIRTLKKMGVASVIVYHAVDRKSLAVRMADEAIELAGDPPVAAYLDMHQIIAACHQSGADAVHPGYGFLSENANFVRRLNEKGITFIGPPAEVIELMGNKVRARAFCLENGFPIAPSAIDEGDDTDFVAAARGIGMPLLIKAAAGGGGKGMQIVRDERNIQKSIELARQEAERSFGDRLVYAERYIERPRHIEVQVLADHHGNIVHLGERECSIQRRFQKIIEEAPSPVLDKNQREAMCKTAVSIAKSANYINAGTVEFIYTPKGDFYFLEMNTRIQVEHPVTEMTTGIDLIEQQICVAQGEKLSMTQDGVEFSGHSIEARLYAEDPENGFAPATGSLLVYDLPNDAARVENGFREGQTITSAFDPMLAKIVVHGKNRAEAIQSLLEALANSTIFGVQSNRDFLINVLQHPEFENGATDTGFITDHQMDLAPAALDVDQIALLMAATALAAKAFNDANLKPPSVLARMGEWRNS